MTIRKTWIIAILILVLGGFAYVYISGMKKSPKRKTKSLTKTKFMVWCIQGL